MCGVISGFSILFRCSICLSLCQYHNVLITVALYYVLKLGHVRPPTLFSFFKIALDCSGFLEISYEF